MSIAVGEIYEGVVTGITKFGAFVKIDEKTTGLVHISEVADTYVKEINDFLQVGDEVKVKVLNVADNGKVGLSIKKAAPKPKPQPQAARGERFNERRGDRPERQSERSNDRYNNDRFNDRYNERANDRYSDRYNERANERFEDKLAEFMKDSNEKLTQLKRHQEGRRR